MSENIGNVQQKNSFKNIVSDPTLLVAKGRFPGNRTQQRIAREEHVDKLARAILTVIASHSHTHVRSVGPLARLNTLDAIEQATSLCRLNTGLRLYNEVRRDRGNLGELRAEGHVQDVDAWIFTVAFFKKENTDASS